MLLPPFYFIQTGRAACDWAAYLALGAAWCALQSPEDHLSNNSNGKSSSTGGSRSSGKSANITARNSPFPPVLNTTNASAAEAADSNSSSASHGSFDNGGTGGAAENPYALSPEHRIASAIRRRHAPSLFACAILMACNGGAEEVHTARSESDASFGDASNDANSEEVPRPKSPGSAKKQLVDSGASTLLLSVAAVNPPSSPLPVPDAFDSLRKTYEYLHRFACESRTSPILFFLSILTATNLY